jgi:hypothetical protein
LGRATVILHIHDAELAALFHHEPVFRHHICHIPVPAPTDVFQAQSAAKWEIKYRLYRKSLQFDEAEEATDSYFESGAQSRKVRIAPQEKGKYRSMFYSWARLSGIGASICEHRHLNILSAKGVTEFEFDLENWFNLAGDCCGWGQFQSVTKPDLPFCLRPLWHHTFIALHADLDILEQAVGRDGTDLSDQLLRYIQDWISSSESKRCLLHALCLQNLVANTALDSTIAIHTPRILFTAALCWQCYMVYSSWSQAPFSLDASGLCNELSDYLMELPEVRLLRGEKSHSGPNNNIIDNTISEFWKILRSTPTEMKVNTLCVLESNLRRLTTSGISRRFADIVQAFILGWK